MQEGPGRKGAWNRKLSLISDSLVHSFLSLSLSPSLYLPSFLHPSLSLQTDFFCFSYPLVHYNPTSLPSSHERASNFLQTTISMFSLPIQDSREKKCDQSRQVPSLGPASYSQMLGMDCISIAAGFPQKQTRRQGCSCKQFIWEMIPRKHLQGCLTYGYVSKGWTTVP